VYKNDANFIVPIFLGHPVSGVPVFSLKDQRSRSNDKNLQNRCHLYLRGAAAPADQVQQTPPLLGLLCYRRLRPWAVAWTVAYSVGADIPCLSVITNIDCHIFHLSGNYVFFLTDQKTASWVQC